MEVMLAVLCEDAAERPRIGIGIAGIVGDIGEYSGGFDPALMARVSSDSRRSNLGAFDFVYRVSL
jgi:hypothetical protein